MSPMKLFSLTKELFLDFLFPKSKKVLNLESLSSSSLLKLLPPAESIKDESVSALFDYKHPLVKELIWQVKYGGNIRVAEKLGEILCDALVTELEERNIFENFERPILMPIPISDKRRLERGWNQAEIICEAVMKYDLGKVFKYKPRQLVKHHHTSSQTSTAGRKERLENLKNSMKLLSSSVVEGQCIVLIDDVYTTGATYTEAKRALKEAGAKKILFFSIGH